mmetsp:Transcript_101282/g.281911  ORF Transcript_101282/g.281911 Transcript_101282/m.281911 type:complete len:217 (+) Transcript_101282:1129-1779(+)
MVSGAELHRICSPLAKEHKVLGLPLHCWITFHEEGIPRLLKGREQWLLHRELQVKLCGKLLRYRVQNWRSHGNDVATTTLDEHLRKFLRPAAAQKQQGYVLEPSAVAATQELLQLVSRHNMRLVHRVLKHQTDSLGLLLGSRKPNAVRRNVQDEPHASSREGQSSRQRVRSSNTNADRWQGWMCNALSILESLANLQDIALEVQWPQRLQWRQRQW